MEDMPTKSDLKADIKVNELFSQLDKLYGLKSPSKDELIKAEELFTKLDSKSLPLNNAGS